MGIKTQVVSLAAGLLLSMGGVQAADEVDPWEGMNRKIFVFNDTLDTYLVKPVAKGYLAVTPDPVEVSVSNFFENLGEVKNIVNDVLQWKWGQAANDSGRLLVNTTIGIAGLFDVAKHMGMPRAEGEDFGQTLADWGVGQGPYLVLPFLGPSTLRDLGGMPVDGYTNPIAYVDHVPTRNTVYATDLLETRASLIEAEDLISGDKYAFMRDAFLQRRNYLVKDGDVEDDFGGDDFSEDDEF